jgi:hypothetical protein
MDKLGSMFFTQLLNVAMTHADNDFTSHRLPVPVDVHIDDFGTHIVIPSFENMIATVRSRNISISIILQSFSQLHARYGENAQTIIACCDTLLYYGGNDVETAKEIALRTDRTTSDILSLARHKVWVIRRCCKPVLDSAFHISQHPDSDKLPLDSGKKYKHTPVKHKKTARKKKLAEFTFEKMLSSIDFNSIMYRNLKNVSGMQSVRRLQTLTLNGRICYAELYSIGPSNVLCLFERRKQMFDELYYCTVIEPIMKQFSRCVDHVILVSYSGFVDQEYDYADRFGVIPIDRYGFEQGNFRMDFITQINPEKITIE